MSGKFYWCLIHNRVEGEEGDANIDRMGPYDTEEEASNALATAKERNAAWDAEDARFKGES